MPELSPVVHRFLDYARINTRSEEPKSDDHPHPTTECQLELIELLKSSLLGMGVADGQIKDVADGSFLVIFPATKGHEDAPNTWLAAHVDTYYGVSGEVRPMMHW